MTINGLATSGALPPGLFGQLVSDSSNIRAQLDSLTQQAASGQKSADYAGLGSDARVALGLQPAIATMQVWQANMSAATSRMQVTQTAMDQITAIASDFYARVNNLNGLNVTNVDTTAAAARDALRQLAGLLNTKDGDTYVFAGQDSNNPPIPNGDAILSSGFYTQIAGAVGGLSTAGATATTVSTLTIASSNAPGTSPFSTFLSQPVAALQTQRASVEVGTQQHQSVGILASANAAVTSAGTSSTGSYMRDLMRSLATIGSLSSSQISAAGFSGLVDDTRTSLRDGITAMTADAGISGQEQAALATMHDQSTTQINNLKNQASMIEDADMASVLTNLSQTQNLLQMSYQTINRYSSLSLVKYLT